MADKTRKSQLHYSGRAFQVRQDEVTLPDGRTTRIDVVDHAGSVVIIPILDNGNLLFVRQYRHPAGCFLLELPAGVISENEKPDGCAHRELREETGMDAGSVLHLGDFFLAPGYSTEFMHVFLATSLFPSPLKPDADEFLSVESIPVDKVFSMALGGELPDAKTLAALFLTKDHINSHN